MSGERFAPLEPMYLVIKAIHTDHSECADRKCHTCEYLGFCSALCQAKNEIHKHRDITFKINQRLEEEQKHE